MTPNPDQLAEQGKQAFRNRKFAEAIQLFGQAASEYQSANDTLMAAEMRNNASVALLQEGKAKESLVAAMGTDQVFAAAGAQQCQHVHPPPLDRDGNHTGAPQGI